MFDRMMRVIKLDQSVYAEVEVDPNATSEAAIVVAIVAILSAIGSGVGALMGPQGGAVALIAAFISAVLAAFLGWLVWAAVTYFIGTNLFEGEATMGEMLRVIGYAYAPRVLSLFSFIPCAGALIALAGGLLSIYTGYLAVKEGLDLDTGKTIITIVLGWIVSMIVIGIIGLIVGAIFGIGAVGVGMLSGLLDQGGWVF